MKDIYDKSIAMTLTDIPYGKVTRQSQGLRNLDKEKADIITFTLEDFITQIVRVTNGSIYIFCGTEQVSEIRSLLVSQGASTRLGIWQKSNPSPMNGTHIWLSGLEVCVFGRFPGATFNEHCKSPIWKHANGKSKIHPTEKPLSLFEELIKASSNENDLILDPCAGSGTTGVACQNTRRNFILIEKDRDYYQLCRERVLGELPPEYANIPKVECDPDTLEPITPIGNEIEGNRDISELL
jgi:site-specific DNA-methyltransferase (adenine-specific)